MGNGDVVVTLDSESLRKFGKHQIAHALEHLMKIDFINVPLFSIRDQQTVNKRLQSICFGNDDLCIFALLGA